MFLYEFLYRGNAQSTGDEETFHVILAEDDGVDAFGRPRPLLLSEALTPARAEALGFSLPKIIADINSAAATRVDELEAQRKQDAAMIDDLRNQLATADIASKADAKTIADLRVELAAADAARKTDAAMIADLKTQVASSSLADDKPH